MIVNCKKCNSEFEIIEVFGGEDVTTECPNCGYENKGNIINSKFITEDTESTFQVKKLNIFVKILRWFIGIVLMIIMLSYILNIVEFGKSDNPFLYYLLAFIAGIAIIPPMRSKTNPKINIIIFAVSFIASIGVFYFLR
ncbi:MAG: hypothetical protein FWD47_09930 [Treponema sp.]|nr:hypothetical protein [Treponema sp.]